MSTQTPNMGLTVPATSIELGPAYANQINGDLSILDSHNHTSGLGVPIPSSGININADLPMNSNDLVSTRTIRFGAIASQPSGAPDIGCLYEFGTDLYFSDGSGNQVRLTQSGGVAGTPGSITGLVSPASATYVSGNQTFVWQSGTNIPANLDAASIIFRNVTAGSNGITVQAPGGLSSNYSITLPALPAAQNIVTLDASGNLSAPWNVDNSTIVVSSSNLQVANSGINTNQLANGAVTRAKLATNYQVLTVSSVGASPITWQIGTTFSTSGRPVVVHFTGGYFQNTSVSGGVTTTVQLLRNNGSGSDSVVCAICNFDAGGVQFVIGSMTYRSSATSVTTGSGPIVLYDSQVSGAYTYKLRLANSSGTGNLTLSNIQAMIYEL